MRRGQGCLLRAAGLAAPEAVSVGRAERSAVGAPPPGARDGEAPDVVPAVGEGEPGVCDATPPPGDGEAALTTKALTVPRPARAKVKVTSS